MADRWLLRTRIGIVAVDVIARILDVSFG